MNEIARQYNLRQAERTIRKHGTSRQNFLKPIKIGPEPFSSQILRGEPFISTTALPPLTRDSKDIPYQGSILKEPGQLQFGNETSISFRTPANFLAYNSIVQWMHEMGNPLDGTAKFCVGDDSTIQYLVTNKQNQIVRGVEFIGVYPSSLGEVQYDNTADEITTFDLTFTYNYHVPLSLDGLDIDQFGGNVNDSDSAQTNSSVVFDQYEALIAAKDAQAEIDC